MLDPTLSSRLYQYLIGQMVQAVIQAVSDPYSILHHTVTVNNAVVRRATRKGDLQGSYCEVTSPFALQSPEGIL